MSAIRLNNLSIPNLVGILHLLQLAYHHVIVSSRHVSMTTTETTTETAGTGRYNILHLPSTHTDDRNQIQYLKNKYKLSPLTSESPLVVDQRFLIDVDFLTPVSDELSRLRIPHQLYDSNITRIFSQDVLKRKRGDKRWASLKLQNRFRHKFLSYEEISRILKEIQRKSSSNPNIDMILESSGQSFEGREMFYVKISRPNSRSKPLVFLDGGIHGREWISPAMAMEIIYQLTLNPDIDPEVEDLLSMFDWVIVPLVNPDGYVFTFTPTLESRLWRKTRTTAYSDRSECYGVDLNRNFGFEWNNDTFFGGSSDPCSMTYSGPHSFSEPESRNLRDLLIRFQPRMKAYFSLHAFGQFFLYPWGFSGLVDIEDENDLHHVASSFAHDMRKRNYEYHVGGTAKTLYPAAGGSDDYVKGRLGVKYAYTIELPPLESSRFGFLLPESEVAKVVTDTWHGFKVMAQRLHQKLQ